MGWGQHLGAPGDAKIPVAKAGMDQDITVPGVARARALLQPRSGSTGDALPCRGAPLRQLLGKRE